MYIIDLFGSLTYGELGLLIFSIAILLETITLMLLNKEYALGKPSSKEKNSKSESREYASKAFNFATITFAIIAIIIAEFHNDVKDVYDSLLLFVFSISLFFASYKLEIFSQTKRILFNLQQRLFNFGFISLVAGIILFFIRFFDKFSVFAILLYLSLLFILIVSSLEFLYDYNLYNKIKNQRSKQPTN